MSLLKVNSAKDRAIYTLLKNDNITVIITHGKRKIKWLLCPA